MKVKSLSPNITVLLFCIIALLGSTTASAQQPKIKPQLKRVIDHWTQARRDAAVPRDLMIDPQGRGYLRQPDGSLIPYGRTLAAQLTSKQLTPQAKPIGTGGSSNDTTPPFISNMQPAENATIGSSHTFSAVITDDASGVKSVSFVITYPDGSTTQTFSAAYVGNDTWETTLRGFSNGSWSWHVVAKDGASRGGNTATSQTVNFSVNTGSSGGGTGGSYIIPNAEWTAGGTVQTAAGRVYFEMPSNQKRKGPWNAYVCSGSVATDDTTGRSIVITAAHCVYDDTNKAFARNVLFIPDQDGTSATGTDTNCNNDPLGCWVPSFGVVDVDWTTRIFPDNIEWDFGYYVVSDNGAHAGTPSTSDSLDIAAGSLVISFTSPYVNDGDPSASSLDYTHALGYSYNMDPNFMYCAEDMTTEGSVNWWLASCELSGGSSGGPWVQPMDTGSGNGLIISVNSWSYTTSAGMAGPKLVGTTASCLFSEAKAIDFNSVPVTDGDAGAIINYCH